MKTVAAFSFKDLGVTSSDHHQGAGTAFTDWDDVCVGVGVGDTARKAAEDALDQLGTVRLLPALPEIDLAAEEFDDTQSAHADCGTCDEHPTVRIAVDDQMECDCHDECDRQYRVALYVRYADEESDNE